MAGNSNRYRFRSGPLVPLNWDLEEENPDAGNQVNPPPIQGGGPPPSADDDNGIPAKDKNLALEFSSQVKAAMSDLVGSLDTLPPKITLADTPRGLSVNLLKHQRYGLAWLCWRERQFPPGGILGKILLGENVKQLPLLVQASRHFNNIVHESTADEMGLGKTVMLLALIQRSKLEYEASKKLPSTLSKTVSRVFGTESTADSISKSTLVIVPPSLLDQWQTEITEKAPKMDVFVYHGADRTDELNYLTTYDIVLSTYQTITSDISKKATAKLGEIKWRRIILDEGHFIRNFKGRTAEAMMKLQSLFRWVVTGTPIHNRPSDMYTLVKFLKFDPFDKMLVWNYWVGLKKVMTNENSDRFVTIGKAILLCRTKEDVKNSINIPAMTCEDVKVVLSSAEREVYNKLFATTEGVFKKFLQDHEKTKKATSAPGEDKEAPKVQVQFSQMLVLLLRLRQLAVLPYLVRSATKHEAQENVPVNGEKGEIGVSQAEADDEVITNKVLDTSQPVFYKKFKSAKIKQLLVDLKKMKNEATKSRRKMEKVIIVSQWTSLLEVIALHLDADGYSYDTISGDVSLEDRADIQREFNKKNCGAQILLLSLTAGGVGLNLTGASRMFFLDVHYNPQLEVQAQSRIHRFGQKNQVLIKRYVSSDTMEERVLKLQAEKLKLSHELLTGTNSDGVQLDLETMKELFRLE